MSSNEAIDRLALAIGHAVAELRKLNKHLARQRSQWQQKPPPQDDPERFRALREMYLQGKVDAQIESVSTVASQPQSAPASPAATPKLLNRKQLKHLGITLSNVQLLRLEKAGRFPRRLYVASQTVAWLESEILRWLEAKRTGTRKYGTAEELAELMTVELATGMLEDKPAPKRRGRPPKKDQVPTKNAAAPILTEKAPPAAGEHDRLVRYDELRSAWGIWWSRVHLDRMERKGAFPKRLTFGHSTVGWLESDLKAYLASAAKARD